ncbi:hypothetical protein [Bradyrhizobium cenepequi]|nr:hypothetical protein [Bradyrhizobium cenepequi]
MTDIHSAQNIDLPGSDLDVARMPEHWLLPASASACSVPAA